MATKIITMMISDLDGATGPEDEITAIDFELDGTAYEIDLTKPQADELRDKLRPFIDAGRLAHTATRRPSAAQGKKRKAAMKQAQVEEADIRKAKRAQNQKIRDWARSQGHPVSSRRIALDTIRAYHNWLAEQERRAKANPPDEPLTQPPPTDQPQPVAIPHFIAP
jgi:nucleoid-associated protein Lsr2